MAVYLSSIVGSASIGVYSLTTDKVVIVPKSVPLKKAERLGEWLHVKLIHTAIGASVLVGAQIMIPKPLHVFLCEPVAFCILSV